MNHIKSSLQFNIAKIIQLESIQTDVMMTFFTLK